MTNSNDAGAGSFRAAVELANGNAAIGNIVFVGNLDPIELQSTVLYDGSQSLMIVGNEPLSMPDRTGTSDAFRAETPGDLSVIGLTIASARVRDSSTRWRPTATGTKHVSLNGVRVLSGLRIRLSPSAEGTACCSTIRRIQTGPGESADRRRRSTCRY